MAWHRLAAGLALALAPGCQFDASGIAGGEDGGARRADATIADAAAPGDGGGAGQVPRLDPGDVRLFFAVEDRVTPRVFRWSEEDSAWNFGPTTTPIGSEIRWLKNAVHESGEEIAAAASQDGEDVRFRVLGPAPGGFAQQLGVLIAGTSAATLLGDVAFESSGDVLAVHADGEGGLDYWFRIDGDWSARLPVPTLPTSAPPAWVVLSPRAGADDVALAWSTTEDEIGVALWNGDAWDDSSIADLGELRDIEFRNFDIAWESSSGDALVAFGSKTDGRVLYANFVRTDGTWSSVRQNTQVATSEVNHVELAADAGSDRIALVITDTIVTPRLGTSVWNGDAWLDSGERSGYGGGAAADFGADVTWLADGSALVAYAGAPGQIGWLRWSEGGWTDELAESIDGVGAIESVRVVPIRSGGNALAVFSDDTGSLFDAEFVGAAWAPLSFGPLTEPPDPLASLETAPYSLAAHP